MRNSQIPEIVWPRSFLVKYSVDNCIGVGGMGAVFRAHHNELDRPVAVKVLANVDFSGGNALLRFEEEARVCSLLNHPNVVRVFDFEVTGELSYIVFELIEGRSLSRIIKRGQKMPVAKILEMTALVCDGLAHAHKRGIIHRDLKPANILVEAASGIPKIADFGLAKLHGVTSVKTKAGMVLGTPAYMSPEQATEKSVGPAGDIYSIGIMLFEMLTGTLPFDGSGDWEILLHHVKTKPPLLREIEPRLPRALESFVNGLLIKNPAERPSDAGKVASRLRSLAGRIGQTAVVLGCRKGQMKKRPVGAGHTGLETSMLQHIGSAIVSRTKSTVLAQGQKILIGLTVILAIVLAWGLLWNGKDTGLFYKVEELSAVSRGASGMLVTWRSTWRDDVPKLRFEKERPRVRVAATLVDVRVKKAEDEGYFEYRALVSNLSPACSYRVSLEKPDGTYSLSRECSTIAMVGFSPLRTITVSEKGGLILLYTAHLPFRACFAKSFDDSLPLRFKTKVVRTYSPKELAAAGTIHVRLVSIDGDELNEDLEVQKLLKTEFRRVYEEFEQEHQSGLFAGRWKGRGRVNDFFRKAAGDIKSKEGNRLFWMSVEGRLARESQWYRHLERVIGGIRAWKGTEVDTPGLRGAQELALIPLVLIDGAAGWYGIERNPKWSFPLGDETHPCPIGYDKPFIAQPAFVRDFHYRDLVTRDHFSLVDQFHPRFDTLSVALSCTTRKLLARTVQRFELDLSDVDLSKFHRAELCLKVISRRVQMVPLVKFQGSSFVAVFRERRQDYEKFRRDVMNRLWAGKGSAAIEGQGGATGRRKGIPTVMRYHLIPMSCLRKGLVTVEISVIAGPTDWAPIISGYYFGKGLGLRMR